MSEGFSYFDNTEDLYHEIKSYIESYSEEYNQDKDKKNQIGFKERKSVQRKQFVLGKSNRSMAIGLSKDNLKVKYRSTINCHLNEIIYVIQRTGNEWTIHKLDNENKIPKKELFSYSKLDFVIKEFMDLLIE